MLRLNRLWVFGVQWLLSDRVLSGDAFSIETPRNLLRTKYPNSKNSSFGKEFRRRVATNFLNILLVFL